MANAIKFIATTSDKISSIELKIGQIIFSTDDRVIYLDTDKRTSFQNILTIATEEERNSLTSPVNGFYYVEESTVLWRYANNTWQQLTGKAQEKEVIFLPRAEFPAEGTENILYVDEEKIYQWKSSTGEYVALSGDTTMEWEQMN